ncbi:MAG: anti-sigma factor family protein [Planctomycetota bacterium]|jgi:hypothetical protein
MSERENPNIEELLNSFIDGELAEDEQNEVQRLISQDTHVAQRLRELQKTKMLVSSLPAAEAPAGILHEIKTSLKICAHSAERAWSEESSDRGVGVRHLMIRKVLAAAAMVGLVAILSGVIYTILAPESDHSPVAPAVAFDGRLELRTDVSRTVNTFIDGAIEAKGLSDSIKLTRQGNKCEYSITCNQEELNSLLADLTNIWERCDSKTLFVNTKTQGERKFDVVNPERAITIVNALINPVKPKITEHVEETEKPTTRAKDAKKVHLSIVVGGSE